MQGILDVTEQRQAVSGQQRLAGKTMTLFMICFLSSMVGGAVSTLMSVYLPSVVKELVGDPAGAADVSAWVNALFIFGWTAGGLCWGIVGDRSSRKRSFWMATATYGFFTVLTGFATSWQWVAAFRFLSGFGIGGVLVTTTILVSEAFHGKKRAVFLGILSISIPLGIFSAGVLNYFVAYWRSGFYVGLLPLALALVAILSMSEDTRWRQQEKDSEGPPATFKKDRNSRKNLFVGSVIFGTALIGLWATFSWMPYWMESMALPAQAQKQAAVAMMLMGGGGLTGGFVSGWITHRLGVKRTMLICFGVCFLVAFTLFKLTVQVTPSLFAQVALLAFFFGVSQGTLSVYIPELFPPRLSATATGLCFNIGRVFTATAVFFLGSLVHLLGGYGNAIFIFSFVFAIGFLFTAFSKSQTYSSH